MLVADLVTTYSIVARDAASGLMGVAVQSAYIAVGAAVPWGEAGVGVVATQSFANTDFGPEGLAMMREASYEVAVVRPDFYLYGGARLDELDALLADLASDLRLVASGREGR